MLLRETGKTLLQHTYEAACAARMPGGLGPQAFTDDKLIECVAIEVPTYPINAT